MYNNSLARMLLCIYAVFWMSWTAHPLLCAAHHHEAEQEEAHHTTAPGEACWQNTDADEGACTLCQIAPPTADLPNYWLPALSFFTFIQPDGNFTYTSHYAGLSVVFAQPRAPPLTFLI